MPEDFMALYQKALAGLETGGKKLEASLQEIEEGKKRAIAGGEQALVSGGLGGTTVRGAIPLAAEKGAARKRLAARGEAEQTYLTTLASFAAFAQRGEEARRQREFEAEQAGLSRESREIMQIRGMQPQQQPGLDVFGKPMAGSFAETQAAYMRSQMGGGGGQAERFPALYGQDIFAPAPSLTDGGYERMDIQMGEPMMGAEQELGPQPGQPTVTGDMTGQFYGQGIMGAIDTAQAAGWTKTGEATGPDGKPITIWRAPDGSTRRARSGQTPGVDFN